MYLCHYRIEKRTIKYDKDAFANYNEKQSFCFDILKYDTFSILQYIKCIIPLQNIVRMIRTIHQHSSQKICCLLAIEIVSIFEYVKELCTIELHI